MKLLSFVSSIAMITGLAAWSSAFAAAPAGSTGECKDGTYTSAESKRGACKGHDGVKDWYASDKKSETKETTSEAKSKEKKSKSTTSSSAAAAAPSPAPAAAPASKTTSASASSSKKAPEGMRTEAAPGGGAGKVWVNTSSKVYHCSGDEWYGKTKEGEYMTEGQAKAQGAHASHGKTCG